jgi:RimJ/RimL family protein N-acetyltransferase
MPEHGPVLTIHGARLTLREFAATDEAPLHAFVSDPEVTRVTAWGPNAPEDTRAFLDGVLADARSSRRERYALAAVETASRRLLGSVELSVESREHRRGELGFVFDPAHWGHGYATEATGLLLQFGFESLELHRIAATCHPENRASARVLEKAGMSFEGRMRGHMRVRDGWRDSLLYAVVADQRSGS